MGIKVVLAQDLGKGLTVSSVDSKVVVKLSNDPGNILEYGTDGGVFATVDTTVDTTAFVTTDATPQTKDGDLTVATMGATVVSLDSTYSGSPLPAQLCWDIDNGTAQLGMAGGNVCLNLGQEELTPPVLNNTGVAMVDMQVVRITGSQGNRLTVALAQANSESNSASSLAVVTEPIANGATGFATRGGIVNNVDTSAFAEGAALYLSPTVAGGITTTKPVAPNHLVMIGWCIRSHATVGKIFVHILNGYELDELHNVLITNAASGHTLIYDAVAGVWKNASITGSSTVKVTNGDGTITLSLPYTPVNKAGDTLTGGLNEKSVSLTNSTIDLNLGNCFDKTITGATTFSLSNVPASGTVASFILDLTNGGAYTIAWWANVKWAGGTAPTLTASGRDTLGFFTRDGGATWTGLVLGKDIK